MHRLFILENQESIFKNATLGQNIGHSILVVCTQEWNGHSSELTTFFFDNFLKLGVHWDI